MSEFLSLCWRALWLWYDGPERERRAAEVDARIAKLEQELYPELFASDGREFPFEVTIRPGRVVTVHDRAQHEWAQRLSSEQRDRSFRRNWSDDPGAFGFAPGAVWPVESSNYVQILRSPACASSSSYFPPPGVQVAQLAARGLLRSAEHKRMVEESLFYGAPPASAA